MDRLGFAHGTETTLSGVYYENKGQTEGIKSPSISDWIKDGGQAEDGPNKNFRYASHFHDPLKNWYDAGLTGYYSSIAWAQSANQDYTWSKVRDHYYQALTTGAEVEYAATFRGVGQLMHLVADLAVPAHVRNDIHPNVAGNLFAKLKGDFYEGWAKNNSDYVKVYLNGVAVSPAIFTYANPQSSTNTSLASVPISALWDENRYDGTNPTVTLAAPATGMIGLAEFTNANFLSQDSMFSGYPYPREGYNNLLLTTDDWLHPKLTVAEDGVEDHRYYIMENVGGTDPIRLAGASFITRETWLYASQTDQSYQLDDRVMQDYANILIPRAIGYSTALLDYFFRGNLEIRRASAKLGAGMTITGFNFEVKNTSLLGQTLEVFGPDSQGHPGQLVLSYEYIPAGETVPVHGLAEGVYKITDQANPYTITTANDPINSDFVKLTATLPSDKLIPYGAGKVAFTVVYSGRLGNEDEAVAAKRYDFSENNSRIAYFKQTGGPGSGNPSDIYSVKPDGSGPLLYTNSTSTSNTWFYAPTWSNDGSMLAFEKQTGGTSYNVQVVGVGGLAYPNNIIKTLAFTAPDTDWANKYYVARPSFSPDGSKIAALIKGDTGGWAMVVFDLASGSASYVKDNYLNFWIHKDLAGVTPAWSPQGDKIAYYIDSIAPNYYTTTPVMDIYTINPLDGSGDHPLTDDGFSMNTEPSWSPDGEWIVFVSDREDGNSLDIWVMDKDGNNKQKIRECPNHCWYPAFSPDGMRIAFSEADNIYRINLDNSGLTQLTTSGNFTGMASWSPFLQ